MAFLIEIPVEGGGRLLVEAADADLPTDLDLASRTPGEIVHRAHQSLERSLDGIQPAMRAVVDRLTAMAPDELTVRFGLSLGARAGAVVAKGSTEVHLAVTLTWRREDPGQPGNAPGGEAARRREEDQPDPREPGA